MSIKGDNVAVELDGRTAGASDLFQGGGADKVLIISWHLNLLRKEI
jgi:hypothetical protein